MTDTFNWPSAGTPQGTVTLSTRTSQFGDGYSQTMGNGINAKSQSWPLTFNGTWSEMQPIMDFLDAHGGYQSFYWTPPGGTQGLYICSSYQPTPQGGMVVSIAATFQQAFKP